ncbi:MAG TPA: hypothetical protein HA362_00985 [Nanoarchaeota archaeon]|nr:hypothetical protein [Nanoarchaeota archaeon]
MALETTLKAYLVAYWQEGPRTAVNYSKLNASFDPAKKDEAPVQIAWNLDDMVTIYINQPPGVISGNSAEFHKIAAPRLKEKRLIVPEKGRESYFYVQVDNAAKIGDAAANVAKQMIARHIKKLRLN